MGAVEMQVHIRSARTEVNDSASSCAGAPRLANHTVLSQPCSPSADGMAAASSAVAAAMPSAGAITAGADPMLLSSAAWPAAAAAPWAAGVLCSAGSPVQMASGLASTAPPAVGCSAAAPASEVAPGCAAASPPAANMVAAEPHVSGWMAAAGASAVDVGVLDSAGLLRVSEHGSPGGRAVGVGDLGGLQLELELVLVPVPPAGPGDKKSQTGKGKGVAGMTRAAGGTLQSGGSSAPTIRRQVQIAVHPCSQPLTVAAR